MEPEFLSADGPKIEKNRTKAERQELPVFVPKTQHIGEVHDFLFAPFHFGRFFEIPLGAHVANNTLAIELLFQTAERAFHGLTFAYFYFDRHSSLVGMVFKRKSSEAILSAEVNLFLIQISENEYSQPIVNKTNNSCL